MCAMLTTVTTYDVHDEDNGGGEGKQEEKAVEKGLFSFLCFFLYRVGFSPWASPMSCNKRPLPIYILSCWYVPLLLVLPRVYVHILQEDKMWLE